MGGGARKNIAMISDGETLSTNRFVCFARAVAFVALVGDYEQSYSAGHEMVLDS